MKVNRCGTGKMLITPPRNTKLVEREEFNNLHAEVKKLAANQGDIGNRVDEKVKAVEGQRHTHEETRRIMEQHYARAIQEEEKTTTNMVSIQTGMMKADENMRAGFAAASREADKEVEMTKQVMRTGNGQLKTQWPDTKRKQVRQFGKQRKP